MKTCSRCGKTKPPSDFYKQADCKDGLRPDCKDCRKEGARQHRANNQERLREYDRRRYEENEDRRMAQRATARAFYHADKQHGAAVRRAYHERKPEVAQRSRAKRKALKKSVEHSPYTRPEIYDRDNATCRGCGTRLPYGKGTFHIDHIVPLALGGPDTPANLQLMCPTCNRAKWMTLKGQIHLPV